MSAQTSYSRKIANATPGLLADLNNAQVISRQAEGGAIPFGAVVSRGTTDTQAVIGGAVPLGITVRDLAREGAVNTGAVDYSELDAMAIMQDGYIYATIPSGGADGAPIKYNITTGVLDAGAPVAGENSLDGAQLMGTVVAGGIGVIRLNSLDVTAGV